jgi:signal peptidase II
MIALSVTLLTVVVSDQVLKLLLRNIMGANAVSMGAFGSVQMVEGHLWLRRLGGASSRATIAGCWLAAAVALVVAGAWISASPEYLGLLLGGSLSNVMESSQRGTVSDYVCLRFWPAFNLADLALAVGAIGTLVELLITLRGATA